MTFSSVLKYKTYLPFAVMGSVFLSIIVWSSVTNAEFYKWVDENGVTHFSENPPEGVTPAKVFTSYGEKKDGETEATKGQANQPGPQFQESRKEANPEKTVELTRAAIAGKWRHMGSSKTIGADKLKKPYKPQSWEFYPSGTVTYRVGNKTNTFPWEIDGNIIVLEPFRGQYLKFEVVYMDNTKMVWTAVSDVYIHVKKVS